MKYYVYVIQSEEGFKYKGMMDNLEKRLIEPKRLGFLFQFIALNESEPFPSMLYEVFYAK